MIGVTNKIPAKCDTHHKAVVRWPASSPSLIHMTKQRTFVSRLTEETLQEIQGRGVTRSWPRHTSIYRTRERCTGIHIVQQGLVKVYRANSAGREQIVLLEGAGGALTIAPIIDQGTHLASAETLKPTTTLFLDTGTFLQLYAERTDFRDAVVAEMARRFRVIVGLLETISLKPVPARVATRIIEVASSNDALDGSKPFTMLLSQDELAHVLATSRESIARALGELRGANVIEQRGSKIRVLDAETLFEWSQAATSENATPLPVVI